MSPTYDADVVELKWLRKTRRLLELPAYMFERLAGKKCSGECTAPVGISHSVQLNEVLTCCNLYPSWERYNEVRRLEKSMNAKVNVGQQAHTQAKVRGVDSPLKDAYHRTFTSTFVGSRTRLRQMHTQDPPEDYEDTQRLRVLNPKSTTG